jgi:hypothetical protein
MPKRAKKPDKVIDINTYVALTEEEATIKQFMFRHFIAVCSKYDINWWTVAGTTLGAVRGIGGLIRWDDDIDVALDETDYDKLKTHKDLLQRGSFQWAVKTGAFPKTPEGKAAFLKSKTHKPYKVKFVGTYMKLEHIGTMDNTGEAKLWLDIMKTKNGIFKQKEWAVSNATPEQLNPIRIVQGWGTLIRIPHKAEELMDINFPEWRTIADVYNHQGPKKKKIKGVETFAKHGGYQYLGRFPLTKELNKAAPGSTSAAMLNRDIPFPILCEAARCLKILKKENAELKEKLDKIGEYSIGASIKVQSDLYMDVSVGGENED